MKRRQKLIPARRPQQPWSETLTGLMHTPQKMCFLLGGLKVSVSWVVQAKSMTSNLTGDATVKCETPNPWPAQELRRRMMFFNAINPLWAVAEGESLGGS